MAHSLLRAAFEHRTRRFYATSQAIFDHLAENSGFVNFGYADGPETTDLARAQRDLVDRATASLPPGGNWLDVGCGVGGPACHLATRHPDIHVTGLNLSPEQLVIARLRAQATDGGHRVAFAEGSACAMPFPDDSFDAVFSIEAAFHFPDKSAFAREALRVLRPGGRLALADIVMCPGHQTLVEKAAVRLGGPLVSATERFTAGRWFDTLRTTGFRDVTLTDISPQTLGLLPAWADRFDRLRPTLHATHPPLLIDFYVACVRHLAARGPDRSPVGYVLLTANRPSRS